MPPFCPKSPDEQQALEQFQDAVIDRLFVLNAERAEEEKRLGTAKPQKQKKATSAKGDSKGGRKRKGEAAVVQAEISFEESGHDD